MLRDKHLSIIDTTNYLEDFEDVLRKELNTMDAGELFTQLLTAVETYHNDIKRAGPRGRVGMTKIDFSYFLFANHLSYDADKLNQVFGEITKDLYRDMISQRMIELDGRVMYGYSSMNGKDLVMRRFNN
jgi:hypothetical protein